jgi:hypothetical protein
VNPVVLLPVYVRIGTGTEHEIGMLVAGEDVTVQLGQEALVGLLRAAADEIEKRAAADQN